MSVVVEARPAPAAELRTSLGLASLAAALIHVMSAVHDGAAVVELAAAGILAVARRAARVHRHPRGARPGDRVHRWCSRSGLPNLFAARAPRSFAGGALALLWGATDRALLRWSRLAFAVFALAALTGFGHLAH